MARSPRGARLGSHALLALLLALALAACGGGGSSSSSSESPEPSEEPSEASGPDESNPIVIGAVGASTGPAAYLGLGQQHGIGLAIEEINAAGGVLGRQLVAEFRDDGNTPDQSLAQARQLVQEAEVAALFGGSTTATSLAIQPYVNEQGLIHFPGSATTSVVDPDKFPYTFRAYLTNEAQDAAAVEFLNDQGLEKIALVYETGAYGTAIRDSFLQVSADNGIEIALDQGFEPQTADFAPVASAVQRAGVDAVFVASPLAADQANLAKALAGAGVEAPLIGTPTILAKNFSELAGDAGDNVIGFTYRTLTYPEGGEADERTSEWLDALSAAYDIEDDLLVIDAYWYDMVKVWAAAVEEAGTTDADPVAEALRGISGFEGIQGEITFEGNDQEGLSADSLTAVYASSYQDGLFQRLE